MKKESKQFFKIREDGKFEIKVVHTYILNPSEAIHRIIGENIDSNLKDISLSKDNKELNMNYTKKNIIDDTDICIHCNPDKPLLFKGEENASKGLLTCTNCGKSFRVINLYEEFVDSNFDDLYADLLIDNLFIFYQYDVYDKKVLDKLINFKSILNSKKSLTDKQRTDLLKTFNFIQDQIFRLHTLLRFEII